MPDTNHKKFLRFGEDIVKINDLFSASWIMNIENFKRIETNKIRIVEDGCFQPFRQANVDVRMTRDWLNFAVEHMSKWWKTINIFDHREAYTAFLETLDDFGHETLTPDQNSSLENTIAIIAFMAYRSGKQDGSGQALTVAMLNATLRSLSRYGIGRVVIAVPSQQDQTSYSSRCRTQLAR